MYKLFFLNAFLWFWYDIMQVKVIHQISTTHTWLCMMNVSDVFDSVFAVEDHRVTVKAPRYVGPSTVRNH